MSEVSARNAEILLDFEHLSSYVRGVTAMQRAYLISGDPAAMASLPAVRADANRVIDRVTANIAGDAEMMPMMARWQDLLVERRTFTNKLLAARRDRGYDAAKAIFDTGEDDRLFSSMQAQIDGIDALAIARSNVQKAANDRLQGQIAWVEVLSLVLAMCFLSVVAFTLIRSITRNVRISIDLVEAMAGKNLSGEDAQPASDDELAVVIHSINRMKHANIEAFSQIAESSAKVAAATTQIEATTREIAHTTHGEQGNVSQFASAVAEMNATVQDVAQHAEHAAAAANDAVSTAASGRDLVRQTEQAMNRISETVKTASRNIVSLGNETQSIGEVVRIIQGIAGQTNLLALNAAIEAARAGEQGKSFAVVAQEVRQLAERTAKFTQEIAAKIESVQLGADRAVQSMREGEAVVDEGVSQFNQVREALDTITQRIQAAQEGIAMIATATTEQSAATGELTRNIHVISSEVGRTSDQVDQTAQACAELAQLACLLQRVVDGFQLPDQLPDQKRAPFSARVLSFERRAS
ncbi:MAG: methyl-accepting chemotaxis protein [Terracidiphilus sp.]